MQSTFKGRILKGVGGLYSVRPLTDGAGEELIRCRARGALRHEGVTPLAGDFVTVSRDGDGDGSFVIDAIVDRKSALIRPPLANLDYLFVTMAAASPSPILTTVDKLTAIAEHNGIEPVIVVTKSSLAPDYARELCETYEKCGFTVFTLSALEDEGVEPIDEFIKKNLSGKTAAFAGASGIGKSTLLNRLFPSLELCTAQISKKIERGRHTTREVTLFPITSSPDTGYVADTPGFSMLDFKRFDFFEKDELFGNMRELAPYVGKCRYNDCTHTKEEGCAVLEAVRRGDIPLSRHQSYVELYDVLKLRKRWD